MVFLAALVRINHPHRVQLVFSVTMPMKRKSEGDTVRRESTLGLEDKPPRGIASDGLIDGQGSGLRL